jgi:hypothetical protein
MLVLLPVAMVTMLECRENTLPILLYRSSLLEFLQDALALPEQSGMAR